MRAWSAVFVVVVVAVVALAGLGAAEAAKPGGDYAAHGPGDDAETIQTIGDILAQAQAEMMSIASGFVDQAPSAASQSEFDFMQGTARFWIGVVGGSAEMRLRGIRDGAVSGPVYDAAVAALQELGVSWGAAMALVDLVEYPASPTSTTTTTTTSSTSTTTTSSTSTTTTTMPAPTTTAPATTTTTTTPAAVSTTTSTTTVPSSPQPTQPGGPTTTVPEAPSTTTTSPGSSTTTVAGAPSTTTTSPGPTTTMVPGTPTTTTVPAAVVAPYRGSGGGGDQFAMAMPPKDGVFGSTAAGTEPPSPVADLSGWVASMLDVVLPPMVVTVVLSPFIIIEVIGRTILRSGSAILVPMLLLGLSILLLRWRDRGRAAIRTPGDEGSRAASV